LALSKGVGNRVFSGGRSTKADGGNRVKLTLKSR
jgi:hypothetical protein